MRRDRYALTFGAMLLVAVLVRLSNAITFPSLRAFDGFGHFTYIWFMADQWRVPLATTGWSFFHPPLYYALMASIWTVLAPLDPVVRLSVGTGLIAMIGLIHGVVAYALARATFPDKPIVALLAAGLMFFLPMHLYSAAFLGNEGLNAILCTMSLVAALWVLQRPGFARGTVLGLCLGAAMLTKFTSLAIVLGTLGTLALQTVIRRSWRRGGAAIVGAGVVMLLVCGWFYARNVMVYGNPFMVSRGEFMVRHLENFQSQGRRNFWEYVLFDPVVLRRPQWPRGVPLNGEFGADFPHSALRESVPTGIYANAWFDAGPGAVLPPITYSETSRRAGQILLTLGLVPSILVVVGVVVAFRRLWRQGWDDTYALMLVTFMTMLTLFVKAMNTVPMHAAVKATYLAPISLTFAFWLAVGANQLGELSRRWLARAAMVSAVLALVSVAVFTNNVFLNRGWITQVTDESAVWQNLYGVVEYAGGNRDKARALFEKAATTNWHLAHENLAFLALQEHRPLEALYLVRQAAAEQLKQSFGTRADRKQFDDTAQADYQNQIAVIQYGMGRLDLAWAAARRAFDYDGSIPEIRYDLALLTLLRAYGDPQADDPQRKLALAQSRKLLFAVAFDDPGFFEVSSLAGTMTVLGGDCENGLVEIRAAMARSRREFRRYPITTGQGNMHTAGLRRRVYIEELPEILRPEEQERRCSAEADLG